MDWTQLNEFVASWAAEHDLPADLKGMQLLLVDFESDQDCDFFYPGRTQFSQKAFTSALSKLARSRNAHTTHVTITPEHYRAWLMAEKAQDTPETRNRFIESRYQVLRYQ